MSGILDLIDLYRGETINLNPFKTRSSADMNPGGKIKVGKYATTSADEAMNYASKKFPNKIMTTKVSPREFKIGQRVFNEVTSDFSDRPNIIKKVANKVKDFTRDRSGQLGYNILSKKNKGKLEVDVLKTLVSNAKALTPLAIKGLTFLSSLPAATITMFLQSTPANSDEINMKLEDFAMLANKDKEGIETIDIGEDND
jgi:hypothetical protein